MRPFAVLLLCLLLAGTCFAGWNDLVFKSPENLNDARQGRGISLTLNITNNGHEDGYAVYILNITLYPPSCVNGGNPVTAPGAIVCPKDDPSCRNRYSGSSTSVLFNFTDMASDPDCSNGLKGYNFSITGTKENIGAESAWSSTRYTTNTSTYYVRFIGPDACGDVACGGNETCATCPADCGRCTECVGGTRACVNNSIYQCVNGFYTYRVEECTHGCVDTDGSPSCRRICAEGEKHCAEDGTTLQTCRDNDWHNETCQRGCADGACQANLCLNVVCPDYCENGISHSYGSCNPSSGECTYYDVRSCSYGCLGAICGPAPAQTPTPAPTPAPGPCNCGAGLVLLAAAGLGFACRRKL